MGHGIRTRRLLARPRGGGESARGGTTARNSCRSGARSWRWGASVVRGRPRRTWPVATSGARFVGTVAAVATALACAKEPGPTARAVLPGHTWRAGQSADGPTYTFRPGAQAEFARAGRRLTGTYAFATDSTVAMTVSGLVPGLEASGPTTLTLQFDVAVLPATAGASQRVVFRAGAAVDTLTRAD